MSGPTMITSANRAASPSAVSHASPPGSPMSTLKVSGGSSRQRVVTSPPWARIEPPSPAADEPIGNPSSFLSANSAPRISSSSTSAGTPSSDVDFTSAGSAHDPESPRNSWWAFAASGRRAPSPLNQPDVERRNDDEGQMAEVRDKATPMISRPSVKKYRSRASWLFDRGASSSMEKDKQPILRVEDVDQDSSPAPPRGEGSRQNGLLLQMPERQQGPFTMSQAKTPGWDSPWVPHNFKLPPSDDAQVDSRSRDLSDSGMNMGGSRGSSTRLGKWAKRRKNIRSCVLHHNYVPLLIRLLNIAFTTGTLAVAIKIRRLEHHYNVLGSLGSSVTLVIIFAPLTLAHVIISIYLEYFGRPLGLWRTSAKLTHTLLETVFICAWSASLSLCFDNYYTSLLDCAPPSSIRWWSELPRPESVIPVQEAGWLARRLCKSQVELISLVFLSLGLYCCNLFISLFRIIEKVKYHAPPISARV